MTVKVRAGISLRRDDNIRFGTMVRLGHGRMGITSDGLYAVGDFVEFQLDLPGWDLTVAGIAEVNKIDIRVPRLNRFLLRVLEMSRSDRQLLQDWYEEQLAEARDIQRVAANRALDSRVGSQVPSRVGRELPRAQRPPPTPSEHPISTWSTDRALSISNTVEHQGSRRQALRAVLRAAYGGALPASGPGGTPEPRADPEVRVLAEVEPMVVELRYHSISSWRADWTAWMYQGLVFARHTGRSPRLDQPAAVRLLLPEQVDLSCPARVVMLHPTGFGLVLDLDPHLHEGLRDVALGGEPVPVPEVARSVGYQPESAGQAPAEAPFWAKLFGLDAGIDPLDEAVDNLVDPLGPLHMDDPRARRRLDAILARADEDYLVLCDQVGDLLSASQWRWPELEDHIRQAREPVAQAAAFIVLAHVTRSEAIQTLRQVASRGAQEPALVEIGPAGSGTCPRCRPRYGEPTTPAALARRGLPPFHVGCQCRVVQVLDEPTVG